MDQPDNLFSSTLEQLGYGKIDESAGKSIPSCDWLFEKDETKDLLVWLCNNINPSNVLTTEELKKFQELEEQGLTLEGEQLEEALETMSAIDNQQDMDSLAQEVANLQQELTKTQNRLSHMVSDRAKLANQHAKMTHRSANLANYNEKLQEMSSTLHQKVAGSVNQVTDSLKATCETINELVSLHERPSDTDGEAAFLSHLPFDSYLDTEKTLLRQVNDLLISTEKRNTKDPISQYDFLGVSEIPSSLMKVESENTRDGFASELVRLRHHFQKSLLLELDAQMKEAKIPAEEQAVKEFDDAIDHLTDEDIMNQLIATQEGLTTTSQTIRTHLTHTVPQLARDLAEYSVLPVLETDLNDQMNMVQRSLDSQLQAIGHLSHQKSRLDFLRGNLLHEEAQHIHTHTLLQATVQSVTSIVGKKITPPASTPPVSSIIDTNTPTTLSRANSMLEKFNPPGLAVVTADTLVNATKTLTQTTAKITSEKEDFEKEREAMLSQLWLHINTLNKVLFAPQSTLQPVLANSELVVANDQLEKLLKVLEGMLTDVLKFQKSKQEEMRYWGQERLLERDIYLFFFNNPDKLIQMHADLKKRVQAGMINISNT